MATHPPIPPQPQQRLVRDSDPRAGRKPVTPRPGANPGSSFNPATAGWAVEAERRYPEAFSLFQPLLKETTTGMERHYLGESSVDGLFEGSFLILLLLGTGWTMHKLLAPTWTDPFLPLGRWVVLIGLLALVGIMLFLWGFAHYLRRHTPALHLYQGQGAEIAAFWQGLLAHQPDPQTAREEAQDFLASWQAREARLHVDAFPEWEKRALLRTAVQWGIFFFSVIGLVYYFLFCGA
ncbi:hypothetical protein E3E11_02845 [Oecophyllibacter saccharovorans]|uniref:hypothetical protein n=1 Tax=Oecophyllibacter saccharovorans TaxID=2558360 RepID=UPI00114315E0|nr:hypothetical protein [Oecophyllibacter saccharovorans]QDH14976.1 hypothetical protein E3E11_02845 [Oecophyllibacter saccharovorans]